MPRRKTTITKQEATSTEGLRSSSKLTIVPKTEIKDEVKNEVVLKDEGTPVRLNQSTKSEEGEPKLGKRTRKQVKKGKPKSSRFVDDEAGESSGEDESSRVRNTSDLVKQYYDDEELRPKSLRLNRDMLSKLEAKAEQELLEQENWSDGATDHYDEDSDHDSFIVKRELKGEAGAFEDSDADMIEQMVGRDVTLPSNKDTKLWRLKVKPGMERQLVMRLTNKLIHYLNSGTPMMVLQVFECETSAGCVYVEAYKLSHVEQLTRGMSGIYAKGLKMIPISEMTDVMKACSAMRENPVQPMQWVRIKRGPFEGDLGLVQHIVDSQRVIVRLMPRIPDEWFSTPEETYTIGQKVIPRTFNGLSQIVKGQPHVKIPQRFFNPVKVQTDCKKEVYKPLGKSFYVWKEMMFRNGMLYHQFNTSKLVIENVSPMLEEVRKFQVDTTASNELLQTYDSDQDEWDLLPDSTVLKTVCNDKQLKVQIGDRCKVQSGQFQNCKGIIQSINTETGIVQMITEEKVPVPIKVHASLLLKFFEVGEQVRILQGLHSGQAGQVIDIVKPELKHAIVLLEHSKVEHKVLISNLRRREELDPNCKHTLSQFLTKGESTTIKEKGQTVKEVYSVGDLVVFNNHTEVGLVLSVEHDCLKVLLENNTTSVVRLSFVQKKIAFETKGVNGRVATRNRIVTTDRFSNVISIRSTVKPTEHSCPFYNCLGEVRAIYKNSLYVMFQRTPNQHLIRDKHNYFAIKAAYVVNAGHEQINQHASQLSQLADQYAFQAGKQDRRQKDFKATGQTVFIARGPLKGYKGRIVFADDVSATIQIYAKGNKQVTLARDAITSILDESAPMRAQEAGPMQISFDEAMNGDFVNLAEEAGDRTVEDGGATPVIDGGASGTNCW